MIYGSLSTRVNFIALNMLYWELTFCAFISTFVFARGVSVHANVVGSVSKACQKRVKSVSNACQSVSKRVNTLLAARSLASKIVNLPIIEYKFNQKS